jgi:hypothetical protein
MRLKAARREESEGSGLVNPMLGLLLSDLYGAIAPEHRADLEKSGLAAETIAAHRIGSVPPSMIERLLGFDAAKVVSAYIIPFADPRGGWMGHVRLRIFPPYEDDQGRTVKYLGPKGAPPRVYFPLPAIPHISTEEVPLWCVEGAKKALAVSQLGLPAVGFEGIEGWHQRGSTDLLEDFARIHLTSRVVELVPDGDVQANPNVRRGALRFADALRARGAQPRLVRLPSTVAA